MRVNITTLNEGDLFIDNGILFEITKKGLRHTKCRYLKDMYKKKTEYLNCEFHNYAIVEI